MTKSDIQLKKPDEEVNINDLLNEINEDEGERKSTKTHAPDLSKMYTKDKGLKKEEKKKSMIAGWSIERSQHRKSIKPIDFGIEPIKAEIIKDKEGFVLQNYLEKLKFRQKCDSVTMAQMYERYQEPVEDPLQIWEEKGVIKVLLEGIQPDGRLVCEVRTNHDPRQLEKF